VIDLRRVASHDSKFVSSASSLKINDDKEKGIFVSGAQYKYISSIEDVKEMLLLFPLSVFCRNFKKEMKNRNNRFDESLYDNGDVVIALEIRNISETGILKKKKKKIFFMVNNNHKKNIFNICSKFTNLCHVCVYYI
jgi:hypothetical protein